MCGIALFLLSLPCLLGYNLWSNFRPIAGRDVLDSEDFLVSNLLLPLGSLLFIIFCTTRYGWGWENFLAEANEGKGLKIAKWLRPYMTYVLPVIVGIILIFGLYNFIDLARFTWNLAKNRQESSFCELTGVAPDDIMIT